MKDWIEYFVEITKLVASRSTCIRRSVGAIAVRNRRIIATGYNGAPSGIPHCEETGCLRHELMIPSGEKHELCRGIHAEQNLIIQAAMGGESIKGSSIFVTNMPCSICIKMLINCEVNYIYYLDGYPDMMTEKFIKESKLKMIHIGE